MAKQLETVSTKQHDYLEQDAPIRGQKYAVVSFVSPEDVLKNKEVFVFGAFMKSIVEDVDKLLAGIAERFQEDLLVEGCIRGIRERHAYLWSAEDMHDEFNAFKQGNQDRINEDFSVAEGSFRTSTRGLKIRGVYESEKEARERIKHILVLDPTFDVYVMEVGCWCPWNPSPESIDDCEYSETQLNTLVKKYKENATSRDLHYESRKRDMIERIGKENDVWKNRKEEESLREDVVDVIDVGSLNMNTCTDSNTNTTTSSQT